MLHAQMYIREIAPYIHINPRIWHFWGQNHEIIIALKKQTDWVTDGFVGPHLLS